MRRQDAAVSGHDDEIGLVGGKGCREFICFDGGGLQNLDFVLQGQFLDRWTVFFAAAPGRPIRLTHYRHNLIRAVDKGLQNGYTKCGCTHKYDAIGDVATH
jgi:hypothetical protein